MKPWQTDWQIEVLLGKVVMHDCLYCNQRTVYHLTIILDGKTNFKRYKWLCSVCGGVIYEKLGLFEPN